MLVYYFKVKKQNSSQFKEIIKSFETVSKKNNWIKKIKVAGFEPVTEKLLIFETLIDTFTPFGSSSKKLSYKELITLTRLLKSVQKYRQDESKVAKLFTNYAENDKRYKGLRDILLELNRAMRQGIPPDKVLMERGVPEYFKAIRIASETGEVDKVYDSLLNLLILLDDTQRKIKKILLVPKLVFIFLYAYFLLIVFYIVPKSRELISSLGTAKLPYVTEILYSISDYALHNPVFFVIISSLTLYGTYRLLYKTVAMLLKYIPYLKDIYYAYDFTIMTAILSVLISARIQSHDAIADVADIVNSNELQDELLQVANKIASYGERMSTALEKVGFPNKNEFYRDFYNTVYAMEDTGDLSNTFEELNKEFKQRLEDRIEAATAFINPLVLIITAVVIITLYAAVNLPLFNIGKKGGY